MVDKNLSVPTIHLNGSNGTTLFEQISAIREALATALDVMGQAAPHGRDYYVQKIAGDDAYGKARREHDARVEKVLSVIEEYEHIQMKIASQLDLRM
jgi:hypothetical protein